ncbi:MAG: hypothetical protein QOF34_882, partial [Sphingomonadales bacterium]|nr:hypothetical protein [Sphingomonadales bacterium]
SRRQFDGGGGAFRGSRNIAKGPPDSRQTKQGRRIPPALRRNFEQARRLPHVAAAHRQIGLGNE